MEDKVTIPVLQQMKRDGRKIVGVVAWDYQIARIADRAGADILSVGDTVGINLWGHATPFEVTLDEMVIVGAAVSRGAERALVSVDFPYGPLQESTDAAVRAAVWLVKESGAKMVKLDGAADFPDAVRAIVSAGIPVFAQLGITPQTAAQFGLDYAALQRGEAQISDDLARRFMDEAKLLEAAGASLLDFTSSGPVAGAKVAQAVSIPVIGGFGGGPWLDGRMRMAHAAIGYGANAVDATTENYANVARIALEALTSYAEDVRAARQIKGAVGVSVQAAVKS